MGPIIGIAFPKSSGILGILRAPGAGGLQAAGQHTQPIVGKSKPERKGQCSRRPCRADNFQGPALRSGASGPFHPKIEGRGPLSNLTGIAGREKGAK